MARSFRLTADGGSRGNPGPAGYGAVVSENGKIVAELFDVIGTATNNVAEYSGLLAGLTHIHQLDPQATIEVAMDSKLVVEQMSGRWQIKHADMRDLAKQCRSAHDPSLVTYKWIPRDENSHADRLANKALDGGSAHKPIAVVQENFLTDRLRSSEVPTMIHLVRHGETILTPTRKFSGTGSLDPELTEDGLAQAERVAGEIAKLQPEVLISSPLKRARQTADAIARATGLDVVEDEDWFEL
jgi:probable phosphoglycerate mutase